MFEVKESDVVFFPFTENELQQDRDLWNERQAYNLVGGLDSDFTVIDLDDGAPKKGFNGNLIIIGHGDNEPRYRHVIAVNDNAQKTASEVAALIDQMGFPKDAENEILVWSCHSGGVGGFAMLLALYLIKHGYTGKKVWGCMAYAGTITKKYRLIVKDSPDEKPRFVLENDLAFYIGR